jgi:hypothetical protein
VIVVNNVGAWQNITKGLEQCLHLATFVARPEWGRTKDYCERDA